MYLRCHALLFCITMADIAECAPFTDATLAISQGKRHLLVRDYAMAVTALAQGCEILAEKHGDTADELGEPYLLYGRALLGLAREEAGVLGGGVPGAENSDDDDDGDDEDKENEKDSAWNSREQEDESGETTEDKDELEEGNRENQSCSNENQDSKNTKSEENKNNTSIKIIENSEQENGVINSSTSNGTEGLKSTATEQTNNTNCSAPAKRSSKESNSENPEGAFNNKERVNQNTQQDKHETNAVSKTDDSDNKCSPNRRLPTQMDHNGDEVKNNDTHPTDAKDGAKGLDENEDEVEGETEDEVNNLQVAWEVLELAKLVLLKRGPSGWKLLADSYRLLGEVAMEGGNHQGALDDLQGCLNLLKKIKPQEPRAIAEIHYQLGLAHSLANDFKASIEQFNEATKLLESRIKELERMTEPPESNDPFYTIEGEIQELKDLLPEIQEKITDMRDFQQEACKYVLEGIKNKAYKECSNMAAGSSGKLSSLTNNESNTQLPVVEKLATDISHLIRKKRKTEDIDTDAASPSKKPAPDTAI